MKTDFEGVRLLYQTTVRTSAEKHLADGWKLLSILPYTSGDKYGALYVLGWFETSDPSK